MTRQELDEILRIEVSKPKGLKKLLYKLRLKSLPERYIIAKFLNTLRHTEYYKSNYSRSLYHKLMAIIWHNRLDRLRVKLKIEIPLFAFGQGLKIYHIGVIIVNGNARIGKNCTIIGSTLIGHKEKGKAAVIGDNVFLGTNSCIIGDVKIGDNAVIGQNVVVTKDVPANTTLVSQPPRKL